MIRKIYSDGFFDVNEKNGFLPIKEPLRYLPELYKSLQIFIDDLPILKDQNNKGILSFKGEVEKRVANITNFKNEVTLEKDPFIIQALFRCYAFITSSFTLAPAHFYFLENNKYGKANVFLPNQIAEPFSIVAKKLDVYPFLDYHYAYSLGNYFKIDPKGGLNWENLGMACSFSGMDDERGFIMLHVDINQHSPNLVKSVIDLQNSNSDKQLNKALDLGYKTMIKINERRQLMWTASRWEHYNDFRIFIMGIKGNDEIFGDGLVYENVSDEPQKYRGQTGAQDNIIPLMDIFSGVINQYPKNELTHYLNDLRSYRPMCIQSFLEDTRVYFSEKSNSLIERLEHSNNFEGILILLLLLDEIYAFRNGHWQFVQKYIMQNTVYPKATGGTPIISWIPNQITAVLKTMEINFNKLPQKFIKSNLPFWKEEFDRKRSLLKKQLEILNKKSYDPAKVYKLNKEMKLNDDKI
tara:strand:- start:2271 stop:3668 length:1398 start_codon:yes stop_codon:yes gene_type:complete